MNPYYIYALKDPRTSPAQPFYIGKGTGARAWGHTMPADVTRKGKRIAEIESNGHKVVTTVLYGEFASNEEFFLSRLFKKDRPLIPSEDGLYPGFCKTAQKPYDVAVTACLIVAKHHLADQFKVSSDGDDNDWVQGRTLCQEVLGYGANFSLGSDKL